MLHAIPSFCYYYFSQTLWRNYGEYYKENNEDIWHPSHTKFQEILQKSNTQNFAEGINRKKN